jgi:hypothetical protein
MDVNLDKGLEEAKATGEDSMSTDPVTPAGGAVKKRRADAFKSDSTATADNVEKHVKTPQGSNNAGLHEMIAAIFGDADLSEDFKTKTTTIFEAALHEKAEAVRAELEEQFEADLNEQVEAIVEDLTDKVDSYLDYVVENWMKENEVALESGYKVEVAESILAGLKSLVEDHNIEIEDEELEAIAAMEEQVAESTAKYNALFEELLAERAEKEELQKNAALSHFTEGMVATDAERFKVLAEGVSYESVDDFAKKLETIKESYFTEQVVRAEDQAEVLEEEVEEVKAPTLDPSVSAYVASLNKFSKS